MFFFSTFIGSFIFSLVDAKNATDIRPSSIKPIIAGNIISKVQWPLRNTLSLSWCQCNHSLCTDVTFFLFFSTDFCDFTSCSLVRVDYHLSGPPLKQRFTILSVSNEMRCEMSPVAGLVRVVPLDRPPLRNWGQCCRDRERGSIQKLVCLFERGPCQVVRVGQLVKSCISLEEPAYDLFNLRNRTAVYACFINLNIIIIIFTPF